MTDEMVFSGIDASWCGVRFVGEDVKRKFWTITCPCDYQVTYPINEFPLVDTPHPCGNPNHWTVKYEEK